MPNTLISIVTLGISLSAPTVSAVEETIRIALEPKKAIYRNFSEASP
jgi:hypothetical protein